MLAALVESVAVNNEERPYHNGGFKRPDRFKSQLNQMRNQTTSACDWQKIDKHHSRNLFRHIIIAHQYIHLPKGNDKDSYT